MHCIKLCESGDVFVMSLVVIKHAYLMNVLLLLFGGTVLSLACLQLNLKLTMKVALFKRKMNVT